MTVLYDTVQKKIIRIFKNGYFVDGAKPELPKGIVELEVVKQDRPVTDETQFTKIHHYADIEAGKYIYGYTIEILPPEEIERMQQAKTVVNRHKTAQDYLENLDLENMNQSQLINAVKALVILNR